MGLLLGFLIVASCKEKPPYIQLSASVATKKDTTYLVSSLPAAEPHNILIENFTGATCTNCPAAHQVIHSIDSQYAGRVNVISLYVTDFSQTLPPTGALYDFRDSSATTIESSIFKPLPGMPIASIDRLPLGDVNNPLLCFKTVWPSTVDARRSTNDSLNLELTSAYDAATRVASITAKITYLQPTTIMQNLSIAIVEDSFVDKQEYFDGTSTGTYDHYQFNDVFRGMVTSIPFGDPILSSLPLKEAKRVYEVTYYYTMRAALKPANCRAIAFVTGGSDVGGATVYQSKQTKIIP